MTFVEGTSRDHITAVAAEYGGYVSYWSPAVPEWVTFQFLVWSADGCLDDLAATLTARDDIVVATPNFVGSS